MGRRGKRLQNLQSAVLLEYLKISKLSTCRLPAFHSRSTPSCTGMTDIPYIEICTREGVHLNELTGRRHRRVGQRGSQKDGLFAHSRLLHTPTGWPVVAAELSPVCSLFCRRRVCTQGRGFTPGIGWVGNAMNLDRAVLTQESEHRIAISLSLSQSSSNGKVTVELAAVRCSSSKLCRKQSG